MRSNALFTFVLLATVASSGMAAPSPAPEPIFEGRSPDVTDIEARAGVGSLLGAAGKGLLTGAGLAGLTTFLQNEFGGSQKRELSDDQLAIIKAIAAVQPTEGLQARAGLGSLLGSAGKGLLTGAGLAGLTTFLQNELGGGSQKRELTNDQLAVLQMLAGANNDHQARGLGSLFVKGGEDIASILGKGIASGVGSGVGASVINGIFGGSDQQKREFYERGLGSLFVKGGEDIASILGKGIAGGVGSGVGASVINGIFGGSDQQRREFDERGLGSLFVKGGEDIASILGKGIAGGVGSGVGASVINGIFGGGDNKRAVDSLSDFHLDDPVFPFGHFPHSFLPTRREPVNPLVGLLLGQGASFGTSQLVQEGIDKVKDLFGSKREPVNPLVGLLAGQAASFGTSQLVQEGIDKVEDLFKGGKRDPVNPLVGLLAGQAASFGTSQLVQEGIDKVEDLFKGGKRELSLNDLD